MPETSIICGAYNAASCFTFKKSVESILNGDYRDFELIICDDGSTDTTWEQLSEYAEADSRIRLIRNEKNIGLAASLNRCLSEARGEFVARHDLDDYSAPDRLTKQIAFLKENPDVSVLGCAAKLFDEQGVFGEERFPERIERRDFLFTSPFKHGSVVFRKDALLHAGGYRVSAETYRTEDYDLFMRMKLFCEMANLNEALYYFLEDEKALRRRKYKYRIDEAKVRYRGFRELGLLPGGIFYVIKPLIVGLIPNFLLKKLRKRRRNKKNEKSC